MNAVDGNAIGGLLIDVFGTEMTAANSTCGTCGARRPVAELVVYQQAPGTVVRCRTCGSVLMVFVKAHGINSVDLAGLARLGNIWRAGEKWRQPRMPNEHPENHTEGVNMPHEESMSMGTPEEESMEMGTPKMESMEMGTPGEDPMSMGTPKMESMEMDTPGEDPMSMGTPEEESMEMGTPKMEPDDTGS